MHRITSFLLISIVIKLTFKKKTILPLLRFLLTKVGPFPDCYERIAENFLKKNDVVSALVTCERAMTIFYGWGHPIRFYSEMLQKIPGLTIHLIVCFYDSLSLCIYLPVNSCDSILWFLVWCNQTASLVAIQYLLVLLVILYHSCIFLLYFVLARTGTRSSGHGEDDVGYACMDCLEYWQGARGPRKGCWLYWHTYNRRNAW